MNCSLCGQEHPGTECSRCQFCGGLAHPVHAGWKFGTCPKIMKGRLKGARLFRGSLRFSDEDMFRK